MMRLGELLTVVTPELAHFLRQPGQRLGHPVLHLHLSQVDVGADAEGHGQLSTPSEVAWDDMYSMFSTPLICSSSGVATASRKHPRVGAGVDRPGPRSTAGTTSGYSLIGSEHRNGAGEEDHDGQHAPRRSAGR